MDMRYGMEWMGWEVVGSFWGGVPTTHETNSSPVRPSSSFPAGAMENKGEHGGKESNPTREIYRVYSIRGLERGVQACSPPMRVHVDDDD